MIDFVHDSEEAQRRDVLLAMRYMLKRRGGMAWFSSRYLQKALRRGTTCTLGHIRRLVRDRELCRVSAPGRGRGKGRTLYWLPGQPKWRVMQELEREGMPLSAVHRADAFFSRPQNATGGERRESLRGFTPTVLKKKDARAAISNATEPRDYLQPLPSGPPRSQPTPRQATAPRRQSDGSPKHGFESVASILGRITDDPASHPLGCGCGAHVEATVDGA